jgi:nicotinic acid mononucleotide adenylyltransferase
MKYNLFIGRYQSPHLGHQEIFDSYLDEGKPVLIAIRVVEPDADNPLTADEVKSIWEAVYANNPLVKIIILPDIESVNYGRGVGYSICEVLVGESTAAISATEIRRQIRAGESDWKDKVDPRAQSILEELILKKTQQ